ncbi:tetratricopeptide repeat protein [Sphingomonas sp. ID1715]|uniref:tetratricopeptide repeat protein n=1 Tax=Sphingomonas sp. ID1715 TaxID=1656898 RepID=UPI00148914A9|nr:tetratricopeptide repeat protein [Sphingomonas sp. ID1715]NNM77347.1 tetratricopeptide repeat protein [Sphingomonas sp. ID1715]
MSGSRKMMLAMLVAGFAATPGAAQTQEQRYGFNAIQRDDLAGAEARLVAQRAQEPYEPSVLINLAHVYAKTGRADQAAALYRQVMAGDNVLMLTGSNHQVWSHDLAQRGLERARQMASR